MLTKILAASALTIGLATAALAQNAGAAGATSVPTTQGTMQERQSLSPIGTLPTALAAVQ